MAKVWIEDEKINVPDNGKCWECLLLKEIIDHSYYARYYWEMEYSCPFRNRRVGYPYIEKARPTKACLAARVKRDG